MIRNGVAAPYRRFNRRQRDAADNAALVAAANVADAANLWVAAHLFNRDPITLATVALSETSNLGVVLMAISPYTMHPVHAAMAAATLDEYFPGRVQLCFGVGAPGGLKAAGIAAERPIETLRETLDVTRELLSGEAVKYNGHRYSKSGRLATSAHPLPLWLAASGPQMLELAGERADGLVISAATSPAFIRSCLDTVRRGEGKEHGSIRKAALVMCSVDTRLVALTTACGGGSPTFYGTPISPVIWNWPNGLDQNAFAAAFAAKDRLRADELMTDDIVMRHRLAAAEQARAMLETYRTAGLDEIVALWRPVGRAVTTGAGHDSAAGHADTEIIPFSSGLI